MPRDGAIIFADLIGDLIGKLDVLRVTCANASVPVVTDCMA
jgi:hypothetical protein